MPIEEEIPLIKFEKPTSVPLLRYDIPSPSSYEGKNYIEINKLLYKDGTGALKEFTFNSKAQNPPTLEDFLAVNSENIHNFLLNATNEDLERDLFTLDLTRPKSNISIHSYSGGYDFDDLLEGTTGDKIPFVHECTNASNTIIHRGIGDHQNILMQSNKGSKDYFIHKFKSKERSATREFWIYLDDSSTRTHIAFREDLGDNNIPTRIYLHIDNGEFTYVYHSADNPSQEVYEPICTLTSKIWYHIKIKWTSDNKFQIWVSGDKKEFTEGKFETNMESGIDLFFVRVYDTTVFIDSFANPKDLDYNEGDNTLNKYEKLNLLLQDWRNGFTEISPELIVLLKHLPEDDPNILKARYQVFNFYVEAAITPLKENTSKRWPVFYKTMGNSLKLRFLKVPLEPIPRLILIETYKLTTFPGDYGAGAVIKTFSLLPREETQLTIKTWKETTETTKTASSILDSFTEEKADEFEDSVQTENSNTSKMEESNSYHVEANAGVSWGAASASIGGGTENSTNSSREEFSKNVTNATEKHAQKASSKRDVSIEESFERSTTEGIETYIMRTIKNLNASRTLNFTFRQMNQQYHTLLHLTDVRIGFYNGYPGSMKEYSLSDIEDLVRDCILTEPDPSDSGAITQYNSDIKEITEGLNSVILTEYGPGAIEDYQGIRQQLIEKKYFIEGDQSRYYLRVIPPNQENGRQQYEIRPQIGDQIAEYRIVDGKIIRTKVLTMRTEGVIVEALLGQAPALDDYALDSQTEEIRKKRLENNRIQAGLKIINNLIVEKNYQLAIEAYTNFFGIQEGMKGFAEIFNKQLFIAEK